MSCRFQRSIRCAGHFPFSGKVSVGNDRQSETIEPLRQIKVSVYLSYQLLTYIPESYG